MASRGFLPWQPMGHFSVLKTRDLPSERMGITGRGGEQEMVAGREDPFQVMSWEWNPQALWGFAVLETVINLHKASMSGEWCHSYSCPWGHHWEGTRSPNGDQKQKVWNEQDRMGITWGSGLLRASDPSLGTRQNPGQFSQANSLSAKPLCLLLGVETVAAARLEPLSPPCAPSPCICLLARVVWSGRQFGAY